jgi:hypothetical protein
MGSIDQRLGASRAVGTQRSIYSIKLSRLTHKIVYGYESNECKPITVGHKVHDE